MMYLILFVLLATSAITQPCEKLLSGICSDFYNSTQMPNYVGHVNQREAELDLVQFKPIFDIKCDTEMRQFMCRLYFPECVNGQDGQISIATKPCYSECRRVYQNCYPIFSSFGFSWPSQLSCIRFPASGYCKAPVNESCTGSYNADECVEYTKTLAKDKSSFWFGTQYQINCPNGTASGWSCSNPRANYSDSIESRLDGAVTLDNLSYPLNINFTTFPETLRGCGGDFVQFSQHSFSPSPAVDKLNYPAINVRSRPQITWPAMTGKFYSLVIYDITTLYMHGVYCNIQDGNLNKSDMVIDYFPALPPTSHPNVHIYLLFEQNQHINSSVIESVKNIHRTDHVKRTVSALGLTNLKAMNWVNIVRDEFSAGKLLEHYSINTCPALISSELLWHHRTFLPKLIDLSYSINVTFTSTSITYTSCCKIYNTTGKTLYLRPLSNGTVDTANVRSSVQPNVNLIPFGFLPGNTAGLFTLVMVDPDVSHTSVGTHEKPLVHWMVINIPDGIVKNGEHVIPYRGPAPPPQSTKYHTYYFLLFKHSQTLSSDKIKEYAGENCTLPGRCLYDLKRFQQEESTVLVGATWMLAHNDPYIRNQYVVERENNINKVCRNVKGYPSDCSDNILG